MTLTDFIFIILFIASIITNFYYVTYKTYSTMVVGTIVGKYKGNKYKGGYIVVEMEVEVSSENNLYKTKVKKQKTYQVPEEYYKEKNIGDTGLFPY